MDKNKTLTEAANDLIEHAMEQGIPGRMIPFVEALRVAKNERKAESDAARQEIASLKAQPYDQQAMGLCHVCGWKGVIDYPDGPVCVACEHDKTLSPQPAAHAQHEGGKSEALADLAYAHGMTTGWNLCIADKPDEFARIRSMRSSQAISTIVAPQPAAQAQEDAGGWMRDGALLYRLTDECRPTNFDEIRVTMANGSRDIGQMSAQAERLLVMLSAPQPTPQPLHVAATSCPHEIDKDKIVLHFDSKQPGKNALAQLAARLQAAQAQPVAMPTAQALDAQRLTKASKDISTVLRVEGMDLEIGSRKLLKDAREAIDAARAAQKDTND